MTLRSIHEATLKRHRQVVKVLYSGATKRLDRCGCGVRWPCPDYEGAVAALKILDNAEREHDLTKWWKTGDAEDAVPTERVLIPDPQVVPPAATDEKRICWKDDCYPGCRCESLTEPVTRDEFFRTGKHLFSSLAATDEKEPANELLSDIKRGAQQIADEKEQNDA